MQTHEINKGEGYVGFNEALSLVRINTRPDKTIRLPLRSCTGCVVAEDTIARVDSPTESMALKDGFALQARDVLEASFNNPVRLKVIGSIFAGGHFSGRVGRGQAVKVCTGSPIPEGADAVLVSELCEEQNAEVLVKDTTITGKNIFGAGQDVLFGTIVARKGSVLLPARIALAAAGGVTEFSVYPKPKVSLVAIGDEVVSPGGALKDGEVYSSNLINLSGWLSCFNIPSSTQIARDEQGTIKNTLLAAFQDADVILTGGGAWVSERDMVVKTLDDMGWQQVFHYVRMGPGKGVTFGLWQGKPVFCLPGSPPSNDIAFLELALPGILRMSGIFGSPFPLLRAKLTQDIVSRSFAWTEFHKGKLSLGDNGAYCVTPYTEGSRLHLIAEADCVITKPEDSDSLIAGKEITVQVLLPAFSGVSATRD